jgi:membrane-bound lytic murein transglycosylase F
MRLLSNILLLLSALSLSGCTPFSENVVKKSNEADVEQAVSGIPPESAVAYTNQPRENVPKLDWATRDIIRSYGGIIKRYSTRYGFDWRLTLAIMKAESGFIDTAESEKGAAGLMQIMPETQIEMARALDIEDVVEPQNNIRAGIFYLSRLYRLFEGADENDRLRLTLASYNAGPGRVLDAQAIARYLRDDPWRWQSVRDALPLLSNRYYTLHQNIWPQKKPRSGTFGSHRETITYVERIMNYYDEYRSVLN